MFVNDAEFTRLLLSLWYAIIAGIIYSLIGYFKRKDPTETFSGDLFLTSVIVGVISGFVAFYMNISPEQAVQMVLAETALLYYIENIVKAVWRRWIQPWIKEKTPTP
jgi:uncharacterized membrane protein HdeD (DUF308 family)